jgi:hypothetical protein
MTQLSDFRDSLVRCSACGAENSFFVVVLPDDATQPPPSCWNCGASVPRPLHLVTARSLVTLAPGRRLYPHHVDRARRLDFREPVARVEAHPEDPDRLGLRNLSDGPWRITKEDGTERLIEPQRLFVLVPGRSVDFGSVSAEVHL